MNKPAPDKKLLDIAGALLSEQIPLELRMEGYSMYPYLRENDRGIIQQCSIDDLKTGDVIAFRQNGKLIAHRLIATDKQKLVLIAKGDKNKYSDPPVSFTNIAGKLTGIKRNNHYLSVEKTRAKFYRTLALRMNKPEIALVDFYLNTRNSILHVKRRAATINTTIRFILQQSKKEFKINALLNILQGIVPFAIIFCIKWLVDLLTHANSTTDSYSDRRWFYALLAITALFFLLNGLLSEMNSYFSEKLGQSINRQIYRKLHQKHSEQELSAYENPKKQDKIHRIVQEAAYRPLKTVNDLLLGIKSVVAGLLLTGIFISVRWYLVVILILAVLPGIVVRLHMARRYYQLKESQSSGERVLYYYNRILTGFPFAKELRLFGFEDYFRTLFHQTQEERYDTKLNMRRSELRKGIAAQAFAVILIFSTLTIVAGLSLRGIVSVGTVVLFLFAFQRGYSVINDLFRSLSLLVEDISYMKDVLEFMQHEPMPNQGGNSPTPFSLRESIRFENVSFSYETSKRDVLSNINVTIGAGKTVALVGENGSGKTTFIKLLCGFYSPQKGQISFDDVALEHIGATAVRNNISAVFQDFALYNLSAIKNIALGNPAIVPDRKKAQEAAEIADIHSTITKLPEGYDTILGNLFQGSEELSIGQWQKIAIARAFYRDATLILMDEPSSALDPKSELQVIQGLKKLADGKTAIIVSHRLSTVEWADEILFFENGQITEQGSHNELMTLNGKYARFFEKQ